MPLAMDRKDEKGNITRGLWNSLSESIGAGFFDSANKENCLSIFRTLGHPFDLVLTIAPKSLARRIAIALQHLRLDKDLDAANLLTSPATRFAYGVT